MCGSCATQRVRAGACGRSAGGRVERLGCKSVCERRGWPSPGKTPLSGGGKLQVAVVPCGRSAAPRLCTNAHTQDTGLQRALGSRAAAAAVMWPAPTQAPHCQRRRLEAAASGGQPSPSGRVICQAFKSSAKPSAGGAARGFGAPRGPPPAPKRQGSPIQLAPDLPPVFAPLDTGLTPSSRDEVGVCRAHRTGPRSQLGRGGRGVDCRSDSSVHVVPLSSCP